jgi:hypothetical protein
MPVKPDRTVKISPSSLTMLAAVFFLAGIGGTVGGAFTSVSNLNPIRLSYADFISIMLSAISVLMTLLALFMAIFAFIGWNSIEQRVVSKISEVQVRVANELRIAAREAMKFETSEIYDGIQDITTSPSDDSERFDGNEQ